MKFAGIGVVALPMNIDHVEFCGFVNDHIPPKPSGELTGLLLGVGVAPLEVIVRVPIAAPSMVMVSGSFYPFFIEVGWLVFVSAVGILVTVIASMFGTIMNDLEPSVAVAVFLHNFLGYWMRVVVVIVE